MANIKSKVKNIAKIAENRDRNNAMKTRVRKAIRAAREAVIAKDPKATELVAQAHSIIATAVAKGVFHPNKGARKSSRLDLFVNEQKNKKDEPKVAVKEVKKVEPVAKETTKPTSKPATKKPTAKAAKKEIK